MNSNDLYNPNSVIHRESVAAIYKLWPFIRQVVPAHPTLATDMHAVLRATQTLAPNLQPLPQAEVDAAQAAAQSSPVDAVLAKIQEQKMTLAEFLTQLFSRQPHGQSRSRRHAGMVSKLLQGTGGVNPRDLVESMYAHHDSAPAQTRGDSRAAQNPKDGSEMARAQLTAWAVDLVVKLVHKEMDALIDPKTSPLRPPSKLTWSSLLGFSLSTLHDAVKRRTPVLLRVLLAAAFKPTTNVELPSLPTGGRARDKRRPGHIVLSILAMLAICRSERANLLQRLLGVWLWSTNAGPAVFAIFSRIGLAVAYTTTIRDLRKLGAGQIEELRALIRRGVLFLILYDNVNIFRRIWAPRLAQQSQLQNGTAMTAVLVEGADEAAFDPAPVQEKRQSGARRDLTVDKCFQLIDWNHLRDVKAHHCVLFLVSWDKRLHSYKDRVHAAFRTKLAKRRIPRGRRSRLYTLGTSNDNEATTRGTKGVFDDIFLKQLQMDPADVPRKLRFVWGDQLTAERARTMLKYNSSCTHDYYSYSSWAEIMALWWHMGWADLARCVHTHFGARASGDPSTVSHVNVLLNRHVKDEDRPDYYPALRLVSQTLKADILDCWRHVLGVENLSDAFSDGVPTYEELLTLAYRLTDQYITEAAAQRAEHGEPHPAWGTGRTWQPARPQPAEADPMDIDEPTTAGDTIPAGFRGDQTLANIIRRKNDFLLQYEFQFAISDGDVGRAVQIIYHWLFTFAGSGHRKYQNEVLELICKQLFEYPEALWNALLDNSVGSLSGDDGSYVPLDCIQEWTIGDIKEQMQKRVDKDFEDDFTRNVIAPNVLMTAESKKVVRNMFGLAPRTKSHGEVVDDASTTRLLHDLEAKQANMYRSGRHYGTAAPSDFAAGYNALEAGRVADFIARTLNGFNVSDPDEAPPTDDATHDTDAAARSAAAALGESEPTADTEVHDGEDD